MVGPLAGCPRRTACPGSTSIAAMMSPTPTMRGNAGVSKLEFFDAPGYGEIARTRNYYSQALRIGDRIEISGQGGWDADFRSQAPCRAVRSGRADHAR